MPPQSASGIGPGGLDPELVKRVLGLGRENLGAQRAAAQAQALRGRAEKLIDHSQQYGTPGGWMMGLSDAGQNLANDIRARGAAGEQAKAEDTLAGAREKTYGDYFSQLGAGSGTPPPQVQGVPPTTYAPPAQPQLPPGVGAQPSGSPDQLGQWLRMMGMGSKY